MKLEFKELQKQEEVIFDENKTTDEACNEEAWDAKDAYAASQA